MLRRLRTQARTETPKQGAFELSFTCANENDNAPFEPIYHPHGTEATS